MLELPLTFFTHITGEMGVHQFLFLERAEGYGRQIMDAYDFDPRDTLWLFSHSGINNVNIDVALRARELGMKVVVTGSEAEFRGKETRHSSGRTLFELADVVIDTCVPAVDASVELPDHFDRIAPVSTMAFVTVVWMSVATVAERLTERGVKLHIHPSHNVPGDTTANERLRAALREYKRRIAGV
jgi:uncharacterized phosphosugar-binding protein